MMSKEKRRVPKLRFPGFTEDWEQRKLESILIEYIEKNPGNENLPVLTSSRQGLTKQEDHFGSVQRHDISDYNVIPLGFCTYRNRSDDKTFTFNINRIVPRGLVSKFYPVFEIKNGNADFITEYLNNNTEIIKSLATNAVGTSQVVLSLRTLRNIEITLPLKEEQVAIGDLMRKLDIYITLHQRKLDNLKLKKKALLQKLFPKNGERYPELRFPGFTDAWEQRELGEIFEYLQNNTLSRDSLNYKNPNIKNIHYGDILVKFDEILDGSNKDIPYINSELDLSKFSKSLLQDGDIIFSDTAEDDTVGKAIELQNVNAPFILSGLHTIPCRPLIRFGKGYLGNFLNSDSYRMQLRPLVQGIKVSSISKSALKDTMIEYPKNLDEQEKIGSLFYHIAKMITLHQRKLDHLQLQKKALLQQMFV